MCKLLTFWQCANIYIHNYTYSETYIKNHTFTYISNECFRCAIYTLFFTHLSVSNSILTHAHTPIHSHIPHLTPAQQLTVGMMFLDYIPHNFFLLMWKRMFCTPLTLTITRAHTHKHTHLQSPCTLSLSLLHTPSTVILLKSFRNTYHVVASKVNT